MAAQADSRKPMNTAKTETEYLLRGYTGRIFLLITFAFFTLKIGQRLLPPLLPAIITDLSITPFAAGVALSTMAFLRAVCQYPSGRFSDHLSRKTVILAGLLAGIVGIALLVSSLSYGLFLLAVVVLGISQGLYDPAARALLSDIFVAKRGKAFGLHIVASDAAGITAAGLAIVVALNWRSAFLPAGILLLFLPLMFIRWSRETVTVGYVNMDVRLTAVRLFDDSRLRWALLAYSLIIFASAGVSSFLAAFLIEAHGVSLAFAGYMFIVLYAVGSISKPVFGWISDRGSRMVVVSGAIGLGCVGLILLTFAPNPVFAIVAVVLYAIGQRGFPAPFQAYLMDLFPDSSLGGDLGFFRSVYTGIGSLGPAYVGFVASRFDFVTAYASMIAVLACAAVILYKLTTMSS